MNHKTEKEIGQNIRVIRERLGMTQELLATKLQLCGCDITRSAVAKIEVGQRHLYPDELILISLGLALPGTVWGNSYSFIFSPIASSSALL